MESKINSDTNAEENGVEKIDYDIFSRESGKTEEERAESRRKNEKRNRLIKALFIAILILFAIIAAVLIYPILSSRHNPNRFAKAYIESVIDGDWKSVYDSSDFGSSPFVSYEAFEKFCNENPSGFALCDLPVIDYTVEADKKEDSVLYYSVHYITADGSGGVYYIELNKDSDGFWFYDEYSAVPTDSSICSATIYAPCSTVITVDGIEVEKTQTVTDKSTVQSGEVTFDEYRIDHIFEGEHVIKAVNPFCDEYTQTIGISKTQSRHYISLTVSEDCYGELLTIASNGIQALYSGALTNSADKSSIGLSPSFSNDKYSSLIYDIRQAAYCDSQYLTVSDISISNAKMTGEYKAPALSSGFDDAICVSFTFDYKYKITNSAENTSEERSDVGNASAYFTYENGKWLMSDITVYAYF